MKKLIKHKDNRVHYSLLLINRKNDSLRTPKYMFKNSNTQTFEKVHHDVLYILCYTWLNYFFI